MSETKAIGNSYMYVLKYSVTAFLIFLTGFILLMFPEATGQGISNGIDLCLGSLIPSLLPFTIVSTMIVNLDILNLSEKVFDKISYVFLRLPGKSIGIILLSILGGYPIGAQIIKELCRRNELSIEDGKRLLLFCVNPGPAFVISSVGFYMLGSKSAGIIIYLSVIISSFIICFLTRFIGSERIITMKNNNIKTKLQLTDEFVRSVSAGSKATLTICAWVILFSGIGNIIEISSFSPGTKMFLSSLLEVTNGCYLASSNLNIPTITCIVAFGGFCTHFQIMSTVRAVKLKYKYFFVSRIIHAALSAVICNFILTFHPVSYEVFSFGTLPTNKVSPTSAALSVSMILMSLLVMLGSTFRVKLRKSKIKRCIKEST